MTNIRRSACLVFLLLIAACASATPAATPTPTSVPTSTTVSTPTAGQARVDGKGIEQVWTVINSDLATDASWVSDEVKQDFDISIADGALVAIAPADKYANPINTSGPHLELTGDFGVVFEMESAVADFAGISLYGALSQGEWWQGMTRLDIGLKDGKLAVGYWNGTSATPSVWQEFSVTGAYANRRIELGLRKLGDEFIILAKGKEIGRIPDPGLFASNLVYFGLNVFPNNKLTLYSLSVEANNGVGVTIP